MLVALLLSLPIDANTPTQAQLQGWRVKLALLRPEKYQWVPLHLLLVVSDQLNPEQEQGPRALNLDLLLPLALELPKPLLPMPMLLSVSPLLALVPPVP